MSVVRTLYARCVCAVCLMDAVRTLWERRVDAIRTRCARCTTPVPPHEIYWSVPGAVKKIITARYRSTDVGHRKGNAVYIRSLLSVPPTTLNVLSCTNYCER